MGMNAVPVDGCYFKARNFNCMHVGGQVDAVLNIGVDAEIEELSNGDVVVLEQRSRQTIIRFKKPIVISGDKNFVPMRKRGKPLIERDDFFDGSASRRVARVNQNVAVGNGNLRVEIVCVGKTNDFRHNGFYPG